MSIGVVDEQFLSMMDSIFILEFNNASFRHEYINPTSLFKSISSTVTPNAFSIIFLLSSGNNLITSAILCNNNVNVLVSLLIHVFDNKILQLFILVVSIEPTLILQLILVCCTIAFTFVINLLYISLNILKPNASIIIYYT
ncbi:hypothetical protein [Alphaentomopoxvirus acuprea]|uniref:Uncharacterized protein n=1 Tax=Alphaentomopoxvirus acuprea TaxID=62099 RepID=W6JPN3_9POXV|nr:hypothetical protein BA82_gp219 [Anomala cuprea entomopoxvirus]BAO49579.1 hypothetical protein [Anomala cuprea entomopoxvirus]